MEFSDLKKGLILPQPQLDEAVHAVQRRALALGMIPIAGVMSRRVGEPPDNLHEILGFGHNHLRAGLPGIHGETGAIIHMGRRAGGYRDVVATSSLNPCPFCQRTLAGHLGCAEVRILDIKNYSPDLDSYRAAGLAPSTSHHEPTAEVFHRWLHDPANALIWKRDIGLYDHPHAPPFDVAANPIRTRQIMEIAHHHASLGLATEAPIGAVIVDAQGEVCSAAHPRIVADNDPSAVAAMSAWRQAGARDHWKDKTLFLTAGPDHIAYAMFHVFNFGQLVLASDAVFPGQLQTLRALPRKIPIHHLNDPASDTPLKNWLSTAPLPFIREHLGAAFLLRDAPSNHV